MSKINYLRKSEVLKNGDYQNYRYYRQSQHENLKQNENNPFSSKAEADAYAEWKKENDAENWKECERLDNARCHRIARLRSKMRETLKRGGKFVTLTFSDEVLAKTKPKTRHEYVKTWLRGFYQGIANIDFGSENGREHYHAVVPSECVDLSSWKYGYAFVKDVKISSADDFERQVEKLSCYSSKLVNHAIKDTTNGYRTIYSGKWLCDTKDNVKSWVDDSSVMAKREKYARKVDADNGVVKSEYSQMSFVRISDDLKFVLDDL